MKAQFFARFLGAALLVFALASCSEAPQTQQAEADVSQIRSAIEEANLSFMAAVNGGDIDVIASFYTENAILMPQGNPAVRGRENIKQFFTGMGAMMRPSEFTLTTGEVMPMGEAICEIGKYTLALNPEGQPAINDNGKYLVIWHPQSDGSWKMHVDMWNTNIQPPLPGAEQGTAMK